jgi:hypothetical protein
MSTEKFKTDLSQGELGERVIANYLLIKRPIKKIEFMGEGKDWDFKCEDINGKIITFEVKTDRYEYMNGITTGNMFIEISCSKKPSGINASKADYFVYYYPDLELFYIMPLPEFRLFLLKEKITIAELCGDGQRTEGYLLDRQLCGKNYTSFTIKKDVDIWI